jgi:uncharacterized protein YutE (UPF0331/DUF86 family)
MTFLIERLAQLRRYVEHLRTLGSRGVTAADLRGDLTLCNDVLHSLQTICQLVIDIAGELAARNAQPFETYRDGILALGRDERFPRDLIAMLATMPGFRNAIVHDYVALDLERVIAAMNSLEPVEHFAEIVASIEHG